MRFFVALIGLILAITLIGIGVPRVVASLIKGPAIASVLDAHGGELLTTNQLETAARYLRLASAWEDSARVRTDLGFLLLLRAEKLDPDDPSRTEFIDEASAVLREGLARAPARPHAWLRLAYAEMLQSGPSPEAAALLEQSLEAGHFVGEISIFRTELLLRNWKHLSFEARKSVGAQIRFIWKYDSGPLIEIARRTGTAPILRRAVRSIPGALDTVDLHFPSSAG